MENLPRRKPGLDLEDLGEELIVYNPSTETASCLNSVARIVFEACDGSTSVAEVSRRLASGDCSEDLVLLTLAELDEKGLLETPVEGLNRRDFFARWGKLVAVLPLVASIAVPEAARAASMDGPGGDTATTTDLTGTITG
ncbi:MAG: PqqD family protein [Vulcanimicrobiota bacterium]